MRGRKCISKPSKPYPDYPLFAHATGRWAKKINGRHVYFGPWDDPEGALEAYQAWIGKPNPGSQTIRQLCNEFLSSRKREVSARTWKDYKQACDFIVRWFGLNKVVAELTPADFARLRGRFPSSWGPKTRMNMVTRIKVVFNFAGVSTGREFKRPSARSLRLARRPRLFTAEQIRGFLELAKPPLRSAILLGINCGFGNADVANLPLAIANPLDYPRPKTGVARRCPLWPETVLALQAARPRYRGQWALSKAFAKLSPGGFYTLRHTFRTIADEVRDQPAVDFIMGHADPTISGHYRQRISDERLWAVVNHVREWLYAYQKPIRDTAST